MPRPSAVRRAHKNLAGVGFLDVSTIGAAWRRPTVVRVKDGWVHYSASTSEVPHQSSAPLQDFLGHFAALASAGEELSPAVEDFAAKWGVLGLCEHGLPGTHRPPRLGVGGLDSVGPCPPVVRQGWFAEPLERWAALAAQAQAMLRAAAALWDRKAVAQADWDALADLYPRGIQRPLSPRARRRRDEGRRLLTTPEIRGAKGRVGEISVVAFKTDAPAFAYAVRRWCDLGDVRHVFTWGDQPEFGVGAQTLFGALALRLAVVATKKTGIKFCRYCDTAYEPRHRERASTACCGSEECDRERQADNTRRQRANMAATRGPYNKSGGK